MTIPFTKIGSMYYDYKTPGEQPNTISGVSRLRSPRKLGIRHVLEEERLWGIIPYNNAVEYQILFIGYSLIARFARRGSRVDASGLANEVSEFKKDVS